MAFTEAANDGVLNNTTDVEIVPAPGAGEQHVVKTITVQNKDTSSVNLILMYEHGANQRQIGKWTLDPDETLIFDQVIVLDDTDKSIQAKLSGSVAANQPEFTAAYAEVS